MKTRKFHLYLADLNPRMGTKPGKVRPVIVVQTDLLNETHPSTLICPITTQVTEQARILRIHLPKGTPGLKKESDLLIDQVRPIDNRRLKKHLGQLTDKQKEVLLENLRIIVLE